MPIRDQPVDIAAERNPHVRPQLIPPFGKQAHPELGDRLSAVRDVDIGQRIER